MREAEKKLGAAFYATSGSAWRDLVTLLHPPYTAWHLSYVVLGAAAAPVLRLDRLGIAVLAFFLAVGVAAHMLDEFQGRPLRTGLSDRTLLAISAFSLAGALTIGVFAILTISLWAIPFVLFGVFIVLAYNLEVAGARFHSDIWFAVSWGAFPALTGYWASSERLDVTAMLIAASCLVLSLAQRALSKQVRALRRNATRAHGEIEFKDGHKEAVTVPYLLNAPEITLRMMSLAVVLLALGWLISRL